MKKLIIIITLFFSAVAIGQNYKTHVVKKGETIESIAKNYKVSTSQLYTLNPDAKTSFNSDMILIIPDPNAVAGEVQETRELTGYKKHRVKRKETLYGIAKEYGISVDDIKKYNTRLYAENLQKGDKIQIPRFKTVTTQEVKVNNTIRKYKVQPKEGVWRVAYKFNISVAQLESLNPDMGLILQPGQELNVPNIDNKDEKRFEEDYNYYTVLKSEGYMALNRKLGVTQEELEAINPELKKDGLKLGMIIKVPKTSKTTLVVEDIVNTNLSSKLTNFKEKKIAVMLPFRTAKLNLDAIDETKKKIRTDALLSASLDFHAGLLMALDSAKQLGISTHLKVFDTQNLSTEVAKILRDNDFSDYDAIIGPMLSENLNQVASELRKDNIPVLSPLTMPINLFDNVYQTIPSSELLVQTMINFVKSDTQPKHVVIISDSKNKLISDKLRGEFPSAKQVFSRKDKEGKEAYYINQNDLVNVFRTGRNIVFLETKNEGFASNVISMVNGMSTSTTQIILMTTDRNKAFDGREISNYHLSNLKFHYPSPNKTTDISSTINPFVRDYRRIYNVSPNKYAVRGFDLTLDLLLRLASADDLYQASSEDIETEYFENKFRYAKKMYGGYYNEAVYIVKYEDLTIVEAKL